MSSSFVFVFVSVFVFVCDDNDDSMSSSFVFQSNGRDVLTAVSVLKHREYHWCNVIVLCFVYLYICKTHHKHKAGCDVFDFERTRIGYWFKVRFPGSVNHDS